MQVGSSGNSLQSQLQALESAALGQYQSSQLGQSFNFLLQTADNGSSSSSSSSTSSSSSSSTSSSSSSSSTASQSSSTGSGSGYQLSGSFTSDSLIAVGTMGPNGLIPFSQQQVQSEENSVASAGQSAYADALQNFMTLSQASGQQGGTYTDQQSYTSANGMVSANFDTSLTLKPVGGGVPSSAS
jgi:hypothetical protein